MQKRVVIISLLLISIFALSLVSAAWYSPFINFLGKITGNAVATTSPCPAGYTYYSNPQEKVGNSLVTIRDFADTVSKWCAERKFTGCFPFTKCNAKGTPGTPSKDTSGNTCKYWIYKLSAGWTGSAWQSHTCDYGSWKWDNCYIYTAGICYKTPVAASNQATSTTSKTSATTTGTSTSTTTKTQNSVTTTTTTVVSPTNTPTNTQVTTTNSQTIAGCLLKGVQYTTKNNPNSAIVFSQYVDPYSQKTELLYNYYCGPGTPYNCDSSLFVLGYETTSSTGEWAGGMSAKFGYSYPQGVIGTYTITPTTTGCEIAMIYDSGYGDGGKSITLWDLIPINQQTCTPKTCADYPEQYGRLDDGCGGIISCTSQTNCAAPQPYTPTPNPENLNPSPQPYVPLIASQCESKCSVGETPTQGSCTDTGQVCCEPISDTVSFGFDMSSAHNDFAKNGGRSVDWGGSVTPFDDVICKLATSSSDKTKTFKGKLVQVNSDGIDGAVLLTGTLSFDKALGVNINQYSWKISGWPGGWFIKDDSIVANNKVSSLLGKQVKCVVTDNGNDISSSKRTVGSCVAAWGSSSAPYKIAFMRGKSSGLDAWSLVAKEDLSFDEYGKISPFAENQNKFSYYIDLNNYDDSGFPTHPGVFGDHFDASVSSKIKELAKNSCGISPNLPIFYNSRTYEAYTKRQVGGNTIFMGPSRITATVVHETGHAFCNLDDEYPYPNLYSVLFNSGDENCVSNPSSIVPSGFLQKVGDTTYKFGDINYGGGCSVFKDFFIPSVSSIMKTEKDNPAFNVISCGYCLSVITRGNTNVQLQDFQACMNMHDTIKPGDQCVADSDCGKVFGCGISCVNRKCVVKNVGADCETGNTRGTFGTCTKTDCKVNPAWECSAIDSNWCEVKNKWDTGCGVCNSNHKCQTAKVMTSCDRRDAKVGELIYGKCNAQGKCTVNGE